MLTVVSSMVAVEGIRACGNFTSIVNGHSEAIVIKKIGNIIFHIKKPGSRNARTVIVIEG